MNYRIIKPRKIGVSSIRMGPFYTVASVELGNTTTKCILVTTNLETAEIYEIAKEVRMTRDVRAPEPGEKVFGKTLVGLNLTRESISEMISDILTKVLDEARLDLNNDLHFVVRSTGVTASFANPTEVGEMVKALAEGCLAAGVPPRKMTATLSPENLPPGIRDYTWLKRVYFDGAVASCLPPANTEVVANEMEGELVTAGLKGAAKGSDIDFRNPVLTLDFGTTLAGRITDDSFPYCKTIGSFAGLAGAIPDSIVQGTGQVDKITGCVIDLKNQTALESEADDALIQEVNQIIRVQKIAGDCSRFGMVPVNTKAAEESGVTLIGVDAGINGSRLSELATLGGKVFESGGIKQVLSFVDRVQVEIVQKILNVVEAEDLVLPKTSLGLTGRAITSGNKPRMIADSLKLRNGSLWRDSHHLLFVEDGLAMGAAVAARCMNSLGTRERPMGGRKGDPCIMDEREQLQKGSK